MTVAHRNIIFPEIDAKYPLSSTGHLETEHKSAMSPFVCHGKSHFRELISTHHLMVCEYNVELCRLVPRPTSKARSLHW